MPAHHTQSRRHINMMILNPRASKIRYLNASHTLLVDLEKHVRKVQELEHKVHKLEAQLQMKEMVKAELLAGQEVRRAELRVQREAMNEEAKEAFANRLSAARKKAKEQTAKRDQIETDILRSWHMKRLGTAIEKMSQVPENEVMLLSGSSPVTESDLTAHTAILSSLEGLVDAINPTDQVERFKELLEERDSLRKIIDELESKNSQINGTVEECKNALHNVNAARIKVSANLNMCGKLLETMQNQQQKRKNENLFVFGPNPLFSSKRDIELNFSISSECIIEMLKELDISQAVGMKNLQAARECRSRHIENRAQAEENLQMIQRSIDNQIELVNNMKPENNEGSAAETAKKPKVDEQPSEQEKEM